MSENRLVKRLFFDFIISSPLVFLLVALYANVLNLNLDQIIWILFLFSLLIAFVVSLIHAVFCIISDWFFWKFAFLLPDEIYYYIFAERKSESVSFLKIDLKNHYNFILSKPEPRQRDNDLIMATNSHSLKKYELKDMDKIEIILWLQKKYEEKLTIVNKTDFYISMGQFGNTYGNSLYLGFSKNIILLLGRSLLLSLLFLAVLLQNPPLMMVVDPPQIQANWTQDEIYDINISVKNIGCDLINVNQKMYSSDKKALRSDWISEPKKEFLSNEEDFIRVRIDQNILPGEYRGSIKITAKADRILVPNLSYKQLPDLPIINTPIIRSTYIKKMAEVPFTIRIKPSPNATA